MHDVRLLVTPNTLPTSGGGRLNGFTVKVGNSSLQLATCYQDRTESLEGPGDVISDKCTRPVRGRIVNISLSSTEPLTLCEVLLYGTFNDSEEVICLSVVYTCLYALLYT